MPALYDVHDPLVARTCVLLLDAVELLHRRGLHQVRALPYMAPSGMYWRCEVSAGQSDPRTGEARTVRYTMGDGPELPGLRVTASTTTAQVADALHHAVGAPSPEASDPAYTRWYAELLAACREHQALPVAFSDSWGPVDGWEIGWNSGVLHPQPPEREHPARRPEERA